ncbi:hypothetical protein WR25_03201 isoform B [Diploscapter pachys]|nr:hypothetical protein WR25_03201 isoform B [Diploscapter pachys]
MKSFQALQDKFEREKEQALEKLRQEHQKEIQLLEQRFSETQLLNLEQKYMLEIQRLEEERKSMRAEKERLGETFEMKLRRAQSLYETELTAAKMLYNKELEALRDHEEALKEELLARQDEFHDRLQELQLQSKRSRDELASCKSEVSALEKRLQAKEQEARAITKELDEARTETNDCLTKLTRATTEFKEYRLKFQEQEEELKRKAKFINTVTAESEKLQLVIKDLKLEVKTLKNKVEFLEKERENLQSQSESQAQLQNSQVDALEAVLENVTKEKESTKEHYENLLFKEKQQAEAREHAMKKEFSSKLNELEEQYTSLKEDLEHSARLDKDELRESTQQEIDSLRREKQLLEAEIAALKLKFLGPSEEDQDEVTVQLAKIVEDTTALTKALEEYRQRICHKDEEISSLRKRLEEEMTASEQHLKRAKDEADEDLERRDSESRKHVLSLRKQITQYQNSVDEEKRLRLEHEEKIAELEEQNNALQAEIEHLQKKGIFDVEIKALEAMDEDSGDVIEMKKMISQKNDEIKKLQESYEQLQNEYEKRCSAEAEKRAVELERQLEEFKKENALKSSQIEELHERVQEMMHQMSQIKEEVAKKDEELAEIKARAEEGYKQQSTSSQPQNFDLVEEHKKQMDNLTTKLEMESIKSKEQQCEIVQLKQFLSGKHEIIRELQEEIENMKQHMNEETTVSIALVDNSKDEMLRESAQKLREMGDRMVEKDEHLQVVESELKAERERSRTMMQKMIQEQREREFELSMLKEKLAEVSEQKNEYATGEVQTDEVQPVTIVDLAKERELKQRIDDLEGAIERKNEVIQQLQNRLPEEIGPENPNRKRSSIMSFQNFVSQIKDKRDESNEKKKAQEEKKSPKPSKDQSKDASREKSPGRAKSPSLLTRFRDRSPAKAKSPNLESTPSTSTRNLLSPSDAERSTPDRRLEDRKGSPSRPLFSRYRKESNTEKRPAWKF